MSVRAAYLTSASVVHVHLEDRHAATPSHGYLLIRLVRQVLQEPRSFETDPEPHTFQPLYMGVSKKSVVLIWTPNSRALISKTPTKGPNNLWKQPRHKARHVCRAQRARFRLWTRRRPASVAGGSAMAALGFFPSIGGVLVIWGSFKGVWGWHF